MKTTSPMNSSKVSRPSKSRSIEPKKSSTSSLNNIQLMMMMMMRMMMMTKKSSTSSLTFKHIGRQTIFNIDFSPCGRDATWIENTQPFLMKYAGIRKQACNLQCKHEYALAWIYHPPTHWTSNVLCNFQIPFPARGYLLVCKILSFTT